MDDLVERLQSLYVWPQSVADHHADVLTPRQIEKLYEVGNVAEQAIARIQALETSLAEVTEDRDLWKQSEAVASAQYDKACEKLAEAEGRVIAEVVAWLRAYKRDDTNWPQVLATAIETGEHLKDSQAPGDAL